jgi:hypothetical protein
MLKSGINIKWNVTKRKEPQSPPMIYDPISGSKSAITNMTEPDQPPNTNKNLLFNFIN